MKFRNPATKTPAAKSLSLPFLARCMIRCPYLSWPHQDASCDMLTQLTEVGTSRDDAHLSSFGTGPEPNKRTFCAQKTEETKRKHFRGLDAPFRVTHNFSSIHLLTDFHFEWWWFASPFCEMFNLRVGLLLIGIIVPPSICFHIHNRKKNQVVAIACNLRIHNSCDGCWPLALRLKSAPKGWWSCFFLLWLQYDFDMVLIWFCYCQK